MTSSQGKFRFCIVAALVLSSFLAACSTDKESAGADSATAMIRTASNFVDQEFLTNAEYLKTAPYADANSKLGERLSMQCRACHTLEPGGATLLGPNLSGLFGRRVATLPGFDYSTVLTEAGFTWTPAALDAWLADPVRFLPGNRMAFAGIRDQSDRDALIAFLLHATAAADEQSEEKVHE